MSRLLASLFVLVIILPHTAYAQTQALRLGCGEFKEEVPQDILSIIQKEEDDGGSLKSITERNFSGYFFGVSYSYLHLEGMFYENEYGQMVICNISFVLKIDTEGKAKICLDKRGGE